MKTENIKITTIATSSNYKASKEFEEMQNRQLLELYKHFQEKPFEYATIDYFENNNPKIRIHRANQSKSLFKNLISKIFNLIKKSK